MLCFLNSTRIQVPHVLQKRRTERYFIIDLMCLSWPGIREKHSSSASLSITRLSGPSRTGEEAMRSPSRVAVTVIRCPQRGTAFSQWLLSFLLLSPLLKGRFEKLCVLIPPVHLSPQTCSLTLSRHKQMQQTNVFHYPCWKISGASLQRLNGALQNPAWLVCSELSHRTSFSKDYPYLWADPTVRVSPGLGRS